MPKKETKEKEVEQVEEPAPEATEKVPTYSIEYTQEELVGMIGELEQDKDLDNFIRMLNKYQRWNELREILVKIQAKE